jgi:hypothetical protein
LLRKHCKENKGKKMIWLSWATCPHTLTVVYFQRRPAHTCSHWSIFMGDLPKWKRKEWSYCNGWPTQVNEWSHCNGWPTQNGKKVEWSSCNGWPTQVEEWSHCNGWPTQIKKHGELVAL